jgi:hypothetical protein
MFWVSVKSKRSRGYISYVKRIFSAEECLCGLVREGNALNDGKGLCQLGRQYRSLCLAMTWQGVVGLEPERLFSGTPSESPRCRSTSRRRLAPEIHDMIREATV